MKVGLYILQLTFFINIEAILSLRLSLATATLITVDRLVTVYHCQQNKDECNHIEATRRFLEVKFSEYEVPYLGCYIAGLGPAHPYTTPTSLHERRTNEQLSLSPYLITIIQERSLCAFIEVPQTSQLRLEVLEVTRYGLLLSLHWLDMRNYT